MASTTDASAQSFWLERLKGADAYTQWVFGELAPYLGSSILEVGCGIGNFTALLGATGADVVALDIDPDFAAAAEAATAAQDNVHVECADVTEARWRERFDTVVMLDVVEHIADDEALLRELGRALVPGGRVIVKVPAMPSIHGTLDEAVGHYRRYTRRSLDDVLARAGFTGVRAWHFNMAAVPGWWLNGKVLRRTVPPVGQLNLFNALVPLLRGIERVVRPGFGLSLMAVGERAVVT